MNNLSIKVFVIITFLSVVLFSQNTNPVVTDVDLSISGTQVTVNYKVADAEQNSVKIMMEVSSDGGTTWSFDYGAATGNIGNGVSTGTELRTINWTYSGAYNTNFKARIIADDLVGDQIYYSGKVYNTVTIGAQVWLKENLDVGTMIQVSQNPSNNSIIEKHCYSNNVANCNTYGGLYQWNEAMQYVTTPGTKGICPTGWHIPTNVELVTLKTSVANNGDALKAIGQGTGTNTSGFSALLAGYSYFGEFGDLSIYAYLWSSSEDALRAYRLYLIAGGYDNAIGSVPKGFGISVRCLKN